MTTTHTISVPGARLRYEVRGAGPLLLVAGAPMAAAAFGQLAEALARDYTVVTHDPRGISGSPLDDPDQDSTPELRADDLAALLDHLGAGTADMFGSSGGAVTGLALTLRHPGRIRTLVAHEPPLLELLPDAGDRRADIDAVIDTFRGDGLDAAWRKFLAVSGYGADADPPPPGESAEQDLADATRFFCHELKGTTGYRLDSAALVTGPTRVVVGVGADSRGLVTHRTSTALAELLGTSPVEFPGDHGGFLWQPEDFAERLSSVLASENAVA
ncbi:alpha/beta hydrolase [Haloechinothrix sp. YIM 98757]|uniref:Alpha/beta hydrolase n=1 Tax=Haloechinothrix aidingensis TaxID=2752311 RepID=A0A838A9G6_9PSEU|nr:alpha/beta hydrolase [Haloechinothrix aidingensis]MBA0125319.1 alpha/beta hydrolase [Haloechinothrix aidingensis]